MVEMVSVFMSTLMVVVVVGDVIEVVVLLTSIEDGIEISLCYHY
jgi:hypothetical protein